MTLDYPLSLFTHSVMSDSLRPHGLQHTRLLVLHHCPELAPTEPNAFTRVLVTGYVIMEVEGHRERESERCSLLALEAEGGATSQGIRWGALELGNRFSPGASRKKTTLLTHFRTSYLQNCNGINLCCFRSLFVVISYSSNRSLLYLHNTQGSLCPARSPLPPSRITLWSWIHVNPR